MEPQDDFEFKPLTDGLGFHKNAERVVTPPPPAPSMPASAPPTPKAATTFTKPLVSTSIAKPVVPASAPILTKPIAPAPQTPATPPRHFVPSLPADYDFKQTAKELNREPQPTRPQPTFPMGGGRVSVPVPGAPASLSALRASLDHMVPSQYKEQANPILATSIPAALLDGVFVFGISMILMVIVLLITKVDLLALLTNASTDRFVQMQLALLYVMVLHMYLLISRSTWFGQSIGEWTYDVQLGTDAQQKSWMYPVLVVWRTILFTVTGFAVLPVLSLIFKKDLSAPLTGLNLRQKEIV